MHELRIAEDLAAIVLEVAAKEKLTRVRKVSIAFGQLVSIVPEIFESAFNVAVIGSLAENTELSVEILNVRLKCKSCGNDFLLDSNLFSCTVCGATDMDIIQGKELFIKSIEGE